MPRSFRIFLLATLVVFLPFIAWPQISVREKDDYRLQVERLKKEKPQQYTHLLEKAKLFLSLPPAKQQAVRELDDKLSRLPSARRQHLLSVMKNYSAWLHELDAADQKKIANASPADKLLLVEELRLQQWTNTLAKRHRDELKELAGAARQKKIAELRNQQRNRRIEWQIAFNHWDALVVNKNKKKISQFPSSFAELPQELKPAEFKMFIELFIDSHISDGQRKRLEAAEGKWPWYPYVLVKLADEHPLALPGSRKWPTKMSELPPIVASRIKKQPLSKAALLVKHQGQFPDFANVLAHAIDRQKPVPLRIDLWPTTMKHLSSPVRKFLNTKLQPVLTKNEIRLLEQADGRWPEYPQTIQRLANKHDLEVPWQTLPPAKKGFWDSYRLKSPRF